MFDDEVETRREAMLLKQFASLYPALKAEVWYPVGPKGLDGTRAEGATRSAGGPLATGGVWLLVDDGVERFVFGHHVRVRETT